MASFLLFVGKLVYSGLEAHGRAVLREVGVVGEAQWAIGGRTFDVELCRPVGTVSQADAIFKMTEPLHCDRYHGWKVYTRETGLECRRKVISAK